MYKFIVVIAALELQLVPLPSFQHHCFVITVVLV